MLKEIMDQLKEDGLPADVEQVLNYAARYLDKSSHLTDMSLFGGKIPNIILKIELILLN